MAFAVVIGAVLVATMLPFLIWSLATMKKGIEGTREDIEVSTSQVQKTIEAQSGNVESLISSQEKLIERIQHLEAIVTSEAWDAHAAENPERMARKLLELDDEPITDEERAADMARKRDRE